MLPRIALVGYGYWGPNILRNVVESSSCTAHSLCDMSEEALARASSRYPSVKTTRDFQEVLADPEVDAVMIATPVGTHAALATMALNAGKHVLVEKPLTVDSSEARALVELAARAGRVLMVGHTFEFSAPVLKVKEIIDSGELGEIRYITSKRVNLGIYQSDVSVIWDLGPHDLSILIKWLGEEPSRVAASGRACVIPDRTDVAFLDYTFPSGVLASIQLSWLSPVKLRETLVVGSKKMLVYDDTQSVEVIKIFDHGVGPAGEAHDEPLSFGEFQLSYRTGDIVSPRLDVFEPLGRQVAHFAECVATGRRPDTDGESGLRVVRGLECAEESWKLGGVPVDIGSQ